MLGRHNGGAGIHGAFAAKIGWSGWENIAVRRRNRIQFQPVPEVECLQVREKIVPWELRAVGSVWAVSVAGPPVGPWALQG